MILRQCYVTTMKDLYQICVPILLTAQPVIQETQIFTAGTLPEGRGSGFGSRYQKTTKTNANQKDVAGEGKRASGCVWVSATAGNTNPYVVALVPEGYDSMYIFFLYMPNTCLIYA